MNNNKGFTIIEMVIALVIISVILLVVVPMGQAATDNSRIANAIASVKAIQTAAVQWANENGGVYTNITFGGLTGAVAGAPVYLPAQFSGVSTNPWGGNYTIAVDPNNSEMVDISLTAVPATSAAKLTTALTKISAVAPTYTAATGTWLIVLQ